MHNVDLPTAYTVVEFGNIVNKRERPMQTVVATHVQYARNLRIQYHLVDHLNHNILLDHNIPDLHAVTAFPDKSVLNLSPGPWAAKLARAN